MPTSTSLGAGGQWPLNEVGENSRGAVVRKTLGEFDPGEMISLDGVKSNSYIQSDEECWPWDVVRYAAQFRGTVQFCLSGMDTICGDRVTVCVEGSVGFIGFCLPILLLVQDRDLFVEINLS